MWPPINSPCLLYRSQLTPKNEKRTWNLKWLESLRLNLIYPDFRIESLRLNQFLLSVCNQPTPEMVWPCEDDFLLGVDGRSDACGLVRNISWSWQWKWLWIKARSVPTSSYLLWMWTNPPHDSLAKSEISIHVLTQKTFRSTGRWNVSFKRHPFLEHVEYSSLNSLPCIWWLDQLDRHLCCWFTPILFLAHPQIHWPCLWAEGAARTDAAADSAMGLRRVCCKWISSVGRCCFLACFFSYPLVN